MSTTVRVLEAELRYRDGLSVHTAASGHVPSIRECYLHLSRGDETVALGEVRTNIAFLTGIDADALVREIIDRVSAIDWGSGCEQLLKRLPELGERCSAPARALIDLTLHDGAARAAGLPLSRWLGTRFAARVPTNQCLFWCDDATLEQRARRYLERGFHALKLRIGIAAFAHDLARIDRLRTLADGRMTLAVDANGAWDAETATQRIVRLAERGVRYVEQPVTVGDWDGLRALAHRSPVPLMLDEGLRDDADVRALSALGGAVWAHLKLVKLGGIAPLLAAARRLQRCGVTVQVGQMNEGGAATAAAVHAAMTVRSEHGELYGADGLLDDPCAGIDYAAGYVSVPERPGLGVDIDTSRARVLWERCY